MREIHQMKASLASVVLVHAGALLAVFGAGAALSTGRPWMWVLAMAGAILLALGVALRAPSQARAYAAYLSAMTDGDLAAAASAKWLDEPSRDAVHEEIRRRGAH